MNKYYLGTEFIKNTSLSIRWIMKYFLYEEIKLHNSEDDCWVAIFNNVFNLTALIEENRGVLTSLLVEHGGSSISHWFDEKTNDVKTYIDPIRNIKMPYLPYGRFLHVLPSDPMAAVNTTQLPWWKDSQYIIGQLTRKARLVKVLNMLSQSDTLLRICNEETVSQIQDRFMEYNQHCKSYTWRAVVNDVIIDLDVDKTLQENGVIDESEDFQKLGLDEDFYVPTLLIYFDDDLTYA